MHLLIKLHRNIPIHIFIVLVAFFFSTSSEFCIQTALQSELKIDQLIKTSLLLRLLLLFCAPHLTLFSPLLPLACYYIGKMMPVSWSGHWICSHCQRSCLNSDACYQFSICWLPWDLSLQESPASHLHKLSLSCC